MALNPQQDRVAELIAAGCTPSQVSAATGFSPSYISQLSTLPEFKSLVVVKSGDRIEKAVVVQDKYDSLENTLLNGIKERAGTADMGELSRALDVVAKNNPKKKALGGGMGEGSNGASVSVTVNLPAHVLEPLHIEVNARNEVLSVGNQSMLPLTAGAIRCKLNEQSQDGL